MKEKDDLDSSNKHIREIVLDIVGCYPDPNWYASAYYWDTFTYYIGGDDLVVEFTDWTNGYCEINLLVEEMSTWTDSQPWFVYTAPTYTTDATYGT